MVDNRDMVGAVDELGDEDRATSRPKRAKMLTKVQRGTDRALRISS